MLTNNMEVTKMSNLLLEEKKKKKTSEQGKMDTRRKNAQQLAPGNANYTICDSLNEYSGLGIF